MGKHRTRSFALVTFVMLLGVSSATAANRYVRAGATGTKDGSDWANAYPQLPSTLVRGDVYYLADGNYGQWTFNTPSSGTTPITVKKCTQAEHGTASGFQSSFCDGQAVIGGIFFDRGDYYIIDGATRNESNWSDSSAYGLRNTGSFYSSRLNSSSNHCADHLTFRYVDTGAAPGSGVETADGGFYLGGFGGGSEACENWRIERSHIHNAIVHVQCAGCSGMQIEFTHFGIGWGKEAIRGQVFSAQHIIRYNYFKDSCQKDPADPTSGCTAEIAMWDDDNPGSFSGNQIYGNIFQKTTSEHNSGGVIVIGGDGTGWVGAPATHTIIANNTIVGLKNGPATIQVNGTNNQVVNNLWYDTSIGKPYAACVASRCEANSIYESAHPFNAYPGDLRLKEATEPGVELGSPFNFDLIGRTRGSDGSWDRGAFEFVSGSVPPPPPPPSGRTLKSNPVSIRIIK